MQCRPVSTSFPGGQICRFGTSIGNAPGFNAPPMQTSLRQYETIKATSQRNTVYKAMMPHEGWRLGCQSHMRNFHPGEQIFASVCNQTSLIFSSSNFYERLLVLLLFTDKEHDACDANSTTPLLI